MEEGREEGGGGGASPGCVARHCGSNRTKLLINTLSRCNLVQLLPAGLGVNDQVCVSVSYSGASFKSGPCAAPRSAASPGDSRSSSLCGRNSLQVGTVAIQVREDGR